MTTNHTRGPWRIGKAHGAVVADVPVNAGLDNDHVEAYGGHLIAESIAVCNRPLIAAAPELLEALEEAVDLAWIVDSHQVQFDATVVFGQFYDFSGLDGVRRIEFYGQHSCIVWPGSKWSAYCTYEGSMWFEKFDTAAEAKEACMRLLDKVLPDHPAMRARAAIAKAKGEQQ